MNKFVWGGAKEKGVNWIIIIRELFWLLKQDTIMQDLLNLLLAEGKNEKAIKVLDYCMETFPVEKLSYDMYVPDILSLCCCRSNREGYRTDK